MPSSPAMLQIAAMPLNRRPAPLTVETGSAFLTTQPLSGCSVSPSPFAETRRLAHELQQAQRSVLRLERENGELRARNEELESKHAALASKHDALAAERLESFHRLNESDRQLELARGVAAQAEATASGLRLSLQEASTRLEEERERAEKLRGELAQSEETVRLVCAKRERAFGSTLDDAVRKSQGGGSGVGLPTQRVPSPDSPMVSTAGIALAAASSVPQADAAAPSSAASCVAGAGRAVDRSRRSDGFYLERGLRAISGLGAAERASEHAHALLTPAHPSPSPSPKPDRASERVRSRLVPILPPAAEDDGLLRDTEHVTLSRVSAASHEASGRSEQPRAETPLSARGPPRFGRRATSASGGTPTSAVR